MKLRKFAIMLIVLAALAGAPCGHVVAGDGPTRYEVTVTNLTRGQSFTPILVASHRAGMRLFEPGGAASAELESLAEEGDTGPLTAMLLGRRGVKDVQTSGGLLPPGGSVTVTVEAGGRFDHLSLGAMLIPTNDGFVALNGVAGPQGRKRMMYRALAYDAGTEVNDETCASIPGPDFVECGGPGSGGAPSGGEEGHVHVHAGIHGVGDLEPSLRDWRNPVASISIVAVGGDDDDADSD